MLFRENIVAIKDYISDLIFPKRCIVCGVYDTYLCDGCCSKIPINVRFSCPMCGQPSFYGHTCITCQPSSSLDGVWIVSEYHNEVLRACIHHFKYKGILDLQMNISGLYNKYFSQLSKDVLHVCQFDYIIPVPMHLRRRFEKGFNHSEILADLVAQCLHGVVLKAGIKKRRFTRPQVELDKAHRLINLFQAFAVADNVHWTGKKVLLVDDVMTTSSTLQECAKVMKEAGAMKIWAIVLAHG